MARTSGCAAAFTAISGPMPAGSPTVIPLRRLVKSQAPSSKSQRTPKSQAPNQRPLQRVSGWTVGVGWDSELGAWDVTELPAFSTPSRPARAAAASAAGPRRVAARSTAAFLAAPAVHPFLGIRQLVAN